MATKWMMEKHGSVRLTIGLWLLMGQVIAVLALKPAWAETLAPLAEDEPDALESAEPAASNELGVAAAAPASNSEAESVLLPLEDGPSAAVAQAQPIAITNIQIEETADGFTLQLDADGELATPATSVVGNATIADIPNAILQLPDTEEFLASNPAVGIALIDVVNLPDNVVRIAVTGTDAPPVVNISIGEAGLTVVGTPGDPTVVVPDDETIQVVVTGEQVDDDYFVPNASTATRTDTPLRDIPQSIQVIPRQVIEDQQATAIEDVLENAAGVTFLGNLDGAGINFALRGFENAPVLRDGFRLLGDFDSSGGLSFPEVANLERVEVLRGPASVLFGQSDPGGVINLVSKQPLPEPYYDLQLQLGNQGFIGPSLDLSGPLTDDGSVLYRLNALVRREDSFRNFENSFDRSFIAPTLAWRISDRTDLTINLEYIDDENPIDLGTVLSSTGEELIPATRVTNNPDDIYEKSYLSAGYTLEHRFSENWLIRNQFNFVSNELSTPNLIALPINLIEPTGTLLRSFVDNDRDEDNLSVYTNVQGQFNTGPIQHNLLFGVDYAYTDAADLLRFSVLAGILSPIDIFDPDYSVVPKPPAETIPLLRDIRTTRSRLGIYLQDQIDILDNLILVAGLRYDTVDQETTDRLADTTTNQYDDALTPRVGIVYQPIEPISLYANYAQSFNPNNGTDIDNQPFDPEQGDGFEVGVRAELIEGRLAANLAYFDITKQNVLTPDPDDPAGQASIATGEQRSQGVDFSLSGEIMPGWNVIASYAYTDARVTEANNDIVDNRLPSIPEHSASLWTTYAIQSGDLAGLGFGLGFNFVGERQGTLANTFQLDSYFLTNAALFYSRENWRFALNIDNVFDNSYIEASLGATNFRGVYPGAPLTVRASLSYAF